MKLCAKNDNKVFEIFKDIEYNEIKNKKMKRNTKKRNEPFRDYI